jgi:hypothetical protein
MAHSSAERRRVFLAYRTVFTGQYAQIRKPKRIKEIVQQHRRSFGSLTEDFGLDKVVDIIKVLLDQCVFESELKAKIAFPELFQTSAARDIQRNASENDAARSATEALEEMISVNDEGELEDYHQDDTILRCKLPHFFKWAPLGLVN